VKLELVDPAVAALDVSAGVVEVGEETVVTETTEEVVEQVSYPPSQSYYHVLRDLNLPNFLRKVI